MRKVSYLVALLAVAVMVMAAQMYGGQIHAQSGGKPGPVQNLGVVINGVDSVTAIWDAPASGGAPTRYHVGLIWDNESNHGFMEETLIASELTKLEFTFTGLEGTGSHKFPHTVVVTAMNDAGNSSPVHKDYLLVPTPPAPVKNLAATADDSSITVSWDKARTGGKAERYVVLIRNTETNKTKFKRPWSPKRQVTFRNLDNSAEGVTYMVKVQARNRTGKGNTTNGKWAKSEWVFTTVTLDGAEAPEAQPTKLKWVYVEPGDPTPPTAVGKPTQYITEANGKYEKYDPVPGCVADEIERSGYPRALERFQADLAYAQQQKASPSSNGMSQADWEAWWQLDIDLAQDNINNTQASLNAARTEAQAKCEAKYPVEENLTQADGRWVQVPVTVEEEKVEY